MKTSMNCPPVGIRTPLRWLLAMGLGVTLGAAPAAEPTLTLELGGGTTLDLVLVKAGEFTQGSPEEEAGRATDETSRPVRLTGDYYIGKSPVTRSQWERFVADTGFRSEAETGTSGGFGWDGTAVVQRKDFNWRKPGFPQTAEHPVCLLTFPDAQAFCVWLTRKAKRQTTLPTEAQWEFACRAGTTTPFHAGNTTSDADRMAWHKGNSENQTHPVSSTQPNPWGLWIGGNVSEWCLDWYAPYPPGAATDPCQTNPNLSDKPRRVLRGGSWLRDVKNTRSAARYRADPRSRNADTGFRVLCAVEAIAPPPSPPKAAPPAEASPPAEADPSVKPQPPWQPPAEPAPPAPQPIKNSFHVAFSSGLGGLLCLAIPIVLIVVLLKKFATNKNAAFPEPEPAPRPSSPPRLPVSPSRVPHPQVRMGTDGFWLNGDWPTGTTLRLHYLLQGAPTDTELIYRPGPEGQFVYTGTTSQSVSAVAVGSPEETTSLLNAAPTLFDQPPPIHRESPIHHEPAAAPPFTPGAY
jgi:formylglycine-generating enzyme required for sulfatase activity